MVGFIITGHGNFASGLLSSIELIIGKQEYVEAIDFEKEASVEDLTKKLENKIKEFESCEGIIFFTDLIGGSPFKCSALLSKEVEESRVISGTNLPMLLEVIMDRENKAVEDIKSAALSAGKDSIKCYSDELRAAKKSTVQNGI